MNEKPMPADGIVVLIKVSVDGATWHDAGQDVQGTHLE